MLETVFGPTLTLSSGKVIPTRWVGEQHVKEDLGFIPSPTGCARSGPCPGWGAPAASRTGSLPKSERKAGSGVNPAGKRERPPGSSRTTLPEASPCARSLSIPKTGRLPKPNRRFTQKLAADCRGLIEPVYQGLKDNHHCYVNEEGLLGDPQYFFMFTDGHQLLAGHGIILSSTDDGGEAPCTLSIDWVKQRVTFMDLIAARQWCRAH